MKSMKIMAYKERRGPLFTLVIPLMDSNTSWKIKAAIEDVIFNVIDKQPENRTLKVDLRVKYDSNSKSYSFLMFDDKGIKTLKQELLCNKVLIQAGIKEQVIRHKL